MAVVAFHAFPDWIRGGFIGVDVFFVISGYLISGIVLSALEQGTFSFSDFYMRRIKRIFPALFLTLVFCLALGWAVLMADEYKLLGKHVAGGSLFVSNFILQQETNYFGTAAESKQLLHLWSLAVEEQFYIVWPLVIWIAFRRKWNFLIVCAIAAAASFCVNLRQAGIDLTVDFYSPLTRFWELMFGSALAALASKMRTRDGAASKLADGMSVAGMLLLVCGFGLLDKAFGFPGKWALVPVLGAVLIIAAGQDAWINRIVLSNRFLVWIGLISFPLYLWHWPLLSFLRTVLAETPAIELRCLAVLTSVALAWLTYRFIEVPVRIGLFGKTRIALLASLVGTIGILGFNVFCHDGFQKKGPDEFVSYFNGMGEWIPGNGVREAYRHECNFLDIDKELAGIHDVAKSTISSQCYTRDLTKSKSLFIWGDSHAQHLYFGLSRQLSPDWQILQVATSGCTVVTPRPDGTLRSALCAKSYQMAIASIEKAKPDVVLISQGLPLGADVATNVEQLVLKMGAKHVIFVGPVTRWQSDLAKLVARKSMLHTPRYTFIGMDRTMLDTNKELKKTYADAHINYIDVMSLLCNDEGCLTYIGDDVRKGLTTRDYGHLLPIASDFLAKNLIVPQIYRIDS